MSWRVATPSLLARLRAVLPDMACVEHATVGALPRCEGRTSFASRGFMVDARGRPSDWGHDGEGLCVVSFLATSLVAPIVAPVVTSVVASVLTAVIAVAAVRMAPARVAPLGSGRRRRRRRRDHGVVPAVVGTPLVLTLTLAELAGGFQDLSWLPGPQLASRTSAGFQDLSWLPGPQLASRTSA